MGGHPDTSATRGQPEIAGLVDRVAGRYLSNLVRIIHTSDWHLGLETGGHSRLAEQEMFLDWLLDQCRRRDVDALLVAGDVYDVLHPPIAAQTALARFLVRFHEALPRATAILIAGNHDSGPRLETPAPFAEALGRIHLVGSFRPETASRHLVPIPDRNGTVVAHCLAIPYLRVSDLDCRLAEGETPESARTRAIAEVYRGLHDAARAASPDLPVIAMGHLTAAGSLKAGSERILIGGVESIPGQMLSNGADYVALGHIHRAQTAGSDTIRYCGSPLSMDFDEVGHTHGIVAVELGRAGEPPSIDVLQAPVFVPMLRFCAPPVPWNELETRVRGFDWSPWSNLPPDLHPLVELVHLADGPVPDLRRRTSELLEGLPVRLVGAPRSTGRDAGASFREETSVELRADSGPEDLLRRHWLERHGTEVPPDLLACFLEARQRVALEART